MAKIIATFTLLLALTTTCYAQTGQVKGCRLTSRALSLRKSQRPLKLTGTVLASGKIEYRVKVTSDLSVDVLLSRTASLRLDIYSLKPATRIETRVQAWSGQLFANNEYSLVLSNCYGTRSDAFQLDITVK
jgi:hypothetical protein